MRPPVAGQLRTLPGLALQPPALALGQPSPDTEPLIVLKCVLQALGPDLAAAANPLSLPGRPPLLRKERLRIGLGAQRPVLPGRLRGLIRADSKRVMHKRDDCVSHSAPPPLTTPSAPWRPDVMPTRKLHC